MTLNRVIFFVSKKCRSVFTEQTRWLNKKCSGLRLKSRKKCCQIVNRSMPVSRIWPLQNRSIWQVLATIAHCSSRWAIFLTVFSEGRQKNDIIVTLGQKNNHLFFLFFFDIHVLSVYFIGEAQAWKCLQKKNPDRAAGSLTSISASVTWICRKQM